MQKIDLSVILPCHNEAETLGVTVQRIIGLLSPTGIAYEIIIMEDGSNDGTDVIGRKLADAHATVRFYHSDQKLGRGRAVSLGIMQAAGDVAGFIDVDLQTPPKYILECYEEIKNGSDVVEAVRYHEGSVSIAYIVRLMISVFYRYVFKKMFQLHLDDTLAGCKFFRKDRITPLLDKVKDNHWFWDTEIMVLAHYEGLQIKEIPSVFLNILHENRSSKTALVKTSFKFILNLIELKQRTRRLYKAQ